MSPARASIEELVSFLGADVIDVVGSRKESVERPSPLDQDPGSDALTFCSKSGAAGQEALRSTRARLVLCRRDALPAQLNASSTFILVDDPRLSFARILNAYFVPRQPQGIHPTAVIHPEAKIGEGCYVGPFASIGRATIGERSVIHGHVHVYDGCEIGEDAVVHAGAVIGADGFGFIRGPGGSVTKFPQIGGVVIGRRVEIGANSSIDRGALSITRIGDDTKLDNFVHVAHNVVLGRGCFLAAHAMVAGSTIIGDSVWLGPGCLVSDHVRIGDGAFITIGAVVTRDIGAGERVSGNFAIPHHRFLEFLRTVR